MKTLDGDSAVKDDERNEREDRRQQHEEGMTETLLHGCWEEGSPILIISPGYLSRKSSVA